MNNASTMNGMTLFRPTDNFMTRTSSTAKRTIRLTEALVDFGSFITESLTGETAAFRTARSLPGVRLRSPSFRLRATARQAEMTRVDRLLEP